MSPPASAPLCETTSENDASSVSPPVAPRVEYSSFESLSPPPPPPQPAAATSSAATATSKSTNRFMRAPCLWLSRAASAQARRDGAGVALGERGVRPLGAEAVVETLPALARSSRWRRGQSKIGERGTEV